MCRNRLCELSMIESYLQYTSIAIDIRGCVCTLVLTSCCRYLPATWSVPRSLRCGVPFQCV